MSKPTRAQQNRRVILLAGAIVAALLAQISPASLMPLADLLAVLLLPELI